MSWRALFQIEELPPGIEGCLGLIIKLWLECLGVTI